MAVPIRRMLRRKWGQAAGNVETAQKYILEIRTYYKQHHPEYVRLCDAALMVAEQLHTFLKDCESKT